MSAFSTACICIPCRNKETQDPDYKRAVEADHEQMRQGNYNFEGLKTGRTFLTKSALVERLRELAQETKLSNELKNETVLLPQPLPTNDKALTGEVDEKWKEYDIAFLLHFIADMCEE